MKHLVWILALFVMGCSSSDVVVVYSPHGAEMLGDYEVLFESAYPGVDVQLLDMGSKDVYSRIRAEKNRPQCDVWWGAPSTMFMQAAEEGLLASYEPTWCSAVDDQFKDAQGLWHATYRSPLAILFNNRQYTAEDMPTTWDGLLEAQWQGKIALRKPLESGTMRTFIGSMIARAENEDAGIGWLKQFHGATDEYLGTPSLLFDHIKKSPEHISVWLMPDIVMQAVRNGYPFDYQVPENTPVLTDAIAIVAGAPHREWAEKFYDFVTTEEALLHQAEAYAKLPARSDIDPGKLPPKLVTQRIVPMPINWTDFAANEKAWCDRWKAEVFDAL